MESALLLDVVVGESPAILQLLPGKDEPLLVRGNPFLVLRIEMLKRPKDAMRWLLPGF